MKWAAGPYGKFRNLPIVLFAALMLPTDSAMALNNCLENDFADMRGESAIQIANDDPTNMFRYRPRCVTISEGTQVDFRGVPNFGMHPMFGGTVTGGTATIDPASPIGPFTTGTTGEALMMTSGEFPYFCDFHFMSGMMGSIRVVPELFVDGFD
jgi:plastocyanin